MSRVFDLNRPVFSMLNRILLYVRDPERVADFYATHFDYQIQREEGDRIIELTRTDDKACKLMLHPLARGRKSGQTLVKLVFDVQDVSAFCANAQKNGLQFGKIHEADGYTFANAKDPAGNSISVSSRAYRLQTNAHS